MQGKTVFITGGTGGIGKQTAVGLAKLGAHVIINGRDLQRGQAAVDEIQQASGHKHVDLMVADLSLLSETQRLAAAFLSRFARLDVLINNVGFIPNGLIKTVEGIQASLVVNHLAPMLLTQALLPLLRQSDAGRVINVTGGLAGSGGVDTDNLRKPFSEQTMIHYGQAKNVMMAASYALASRLKDTGVTLNVAYPGLADTAMTRSMSGGAPFLARLLRPLFLLMLANATPEKAAYSSLYLASSPDVAGVSGSYFNPKGQSIRWPSSIIKDDLPEQVWKLTMEALHSYESSRSL